MAPRLPPARASIHHTRVRRRRSVALGLLGLIVLAVAFAVIYPRISGSSEATGQAASTTEATTEAPPASTASATTAAATTSAAPAVAARPAHVGPPSDKTRLKLIKTIGGDISPKSVVSSGTGYITAQNMMYRHTVTVYGAKSMRLIATIPDSVVLAKYGYKGHPGSSKGAPVEATFSPDGKYEYVTNYSMYGAGFGPEALDTCTPASGYDRSFAYRIKTGSWKIDQVYEVGSVPKVVQATADGKYVLISNWCSWDLSVISTAKGRVVRTIPIGAYPRGIAISPKGNAAYVAVMGGSNLVRVDLKSWKTRSIQIGSGPRAIEFAPNDRYIYATLNAEGTVAKLDLRTGNVAKVATGQAPRSLTISSDGKAIYVVNYKSASISKIRTRNMKVLQTIDACQQPIGIAYDAPTARVWAACYGGSLLVFNDR
jgi:YVTN family beta-propeller protein